MNDGRNENQSMEELLRADARRMEIAPGPSEADFQDLRRVLRPAIASASLAARRRRKLHRQALIMTAAAVPVAILLILCAYGAYLGNIALAKQFAWPAGIFSLCALLTLPIMEVFLTERQSYDNGGSIHAE